MNNRWRALSVAPVENPPDAASIQALASVPRCARSEKRHIQLYAKRYYLRTAEFLELVYW